MTGISAIILAGGESRRMGSNKALLSLDGQPLIARTAACLRPLADDLIVVTNTPEAYQFLVADFAARLIPDALPARSALVGLYSGLRMARGDLRISGSTHISALAVACDMPFLNPALLGFMLTLAQAGYDVVVPQVNDLLEPLHAVYRPASCTPAVERHLLAGDRRMISFYAAVQVCQVTAADVARFDPGRLSFVNVNTPEEWKRWQMFSSASKS